ncbi:MAG: S24/S26 family peptidase [Lachnospiraceae bacterium]|nr:S24/S26 family peptidase [Lachnospiraceae bacterium]
MGEIQIEQLLDQGNTVSIKPQGHSMYPMFIPGRDEAILEKAEPSRLKRGDVVLYRRDQGILVIHRIIRSTEEGFYLVGDNQHEIEGPLRPDQMKGVLTAFIRNGRYVSVRNPVYRAASHLWLFLCPVRVPLKNFVASWKRRIRGRREGKRE